MQPRKIHSRLATTKLHGYYNLMYVLFLACVNQNWEPELLLDGAASHAPFFSPLFLCAAFHTYDDVPQSCEHLAPPRHTNVFGDTK